MTKIQVKIGDKYGLLTLVKEIKPFIQKNGEKLRTFKCKCDCGKIKNVYLTYLRRGKTKSCGCLLIGGSRKTHNMACTRFYHIWAGIKQRCDNKKNPNYSSYGGRGIKYDNKWSSFENFKEDMYLEYKKHSNIFGEKQTSIERIDVNGNYCKNNCKWATRLEQGRNTTVSINSYLRDKINIAKNKYKKNLLGIISKRIIIHNGIGKNMKEWAKIQGIRYGVVASRISVLGWSKKRALELI